MATPGQGVPAVAGGEAGSVEVVVVVVVVLVVVVVDDVDVVVVDAGAEVDVVVVDGAWVVVVVAAGLAGGTGKVHSAAAQSVGVVATTTRTPGSAESVTHLERWTGQEAGRAPGPWSRGPTASRRPGRCPRADGTATGVRLMLLTPS